MVGLHGIAKDNHKVRKVYNYIKIEGPLRSVYLLFFLEMYIDLLLGGLVNTENAYLFDTPGNFGPNGYLAMSD